MGNVTMKEMPNAGNPRKRIISSILTVFGLVGVSLSATVEYKPSATPYDWANTAFWYSSGTVINRVPTSSDVTWLTDSKMRSNALNIYAGTAAVTAGFNLSNASTSADPILLNVDGGTLHVCGECKYGQQAAGLLTIMNGGSVTNDSKVWIGTAVSSSNIASGKRATFDARVNVADATSSLVLKSGLFIGNQKGGVSSLENHGTVQLLSSSATASSRDVFLGWASVSRTQGDILSVIDNYGTITATSNQRYYLGGTSGQFGIITNHVGATIKNAYAISVGSASNAVGRLVNEGTINVTRLAVGGDTYNEDAANTDPESFGQGLMENSGTINLSGIFRVGWQTNGVGCVENTGTINSSGELIIGYFPGAKGRLRHSAGLLNFYNTTGKNTVMAGYQGDGSLELAGDTQTVFDKINLHLASNGASSKFSSHGELVITNAATLSLGKNNLPAGIQKNSSARIALYDDAKLGDIGLLSFGNPTTTNVFEMAGNSVVSNVDLAVIDVGNAANAVTGLTTLRLADNAAFRGMNSAWIGSNAYNNVTLEIADNASFSLADDAWEDGSNSIYVASDSSRRGRGTVRLRGGRIGLGIRGWLQLGDTTDTSASGCAASLVGYGCVTNQGDSSKSYWSRLLMRSATVIADGEGEERDLDLRTIARVSGTFGEGRSHLNSSGTNGWYAINKGRLRYPMRDCGDNSSKSWVRFVGEYARLAASVAPTFVNAMRIILYDSGSEIEQASGRCLSLDLCALDRTDIPGGLVTNPNRGRALGVWHGGVTRNYAHTTTYDFGTAETTIRFNHWLLEDLKDSDGNYPADLRVALLQYDGTGWKRRGMRLLSEAKADGYRITGTLRSLGGVDNFGWFAVVACKSDGMTVIVK